MAAPKLTPMMEQYLEVRRSLPANTLLLFRLGDFYEMFHEDAEEGARLLGITLTRRNDYPMAGIPYHAAETYINKLLAVGKKVAVCDQTETPQPGKLVRRALTRILSPGTTLGEDQLESRKNHYIAAIDFPARGGARLAWMDLSTGEFMLAAEDHPGALLPVLASIDPAEILVSEEASWITPPPPGSHPDPVLAELRDLLRGRTVTELPASRFERPAGARAVLEALGVLNLEGFGLALDHSALGAAGAVVAYVTENLRARPENLRTLREYRSTTALQLDPATLRNLEIFRSIRGGREGSLLHAIDRTLTPGGARLLEQWLIAPSLDLAELRRRHAAIGAFLLHPAPADTLRAELRGTRDLARILGRLQNRLRHPRELGAIRDTLARLPALHATLENFPEPEVHALRERLRLFPELLDHLQRALNDDLPADLKDGGAIRPGFDSELDRLHSLTSDNRTWLSDLERSEQERTGIKSLKVKFNNAFGYFIEVTKSNLHLVPDDYLRKQTMVNGERYVTEALKQKEKEIFHAEENARAREATLFADLVARTLEDAPALHATAGLLSELDLFLGWARLASDWGYCRPELDDSDGLDIREGRHPVVEQMLRESEVDRAGGFAFVPNDTTMAASGDQILLLTGPNMAGKSTYIRQVALITLMAQIGSWVPAESCTLGLVDRIFSRVGASDDLARGNSTFMVEMNETANILNHATPRSLVILDEIGRGTSTYDGLSIAWAVVEHLHRDPEAGPRTLFATHYHELTQLARHLHRLKNYSVAVKEYNDDIVFVRRVVAGPADRSYGIQVARLAGLPHEVVDRAKHILEKLESEEGAVTVAAPEPRAQPRRTIRVTPADPNQLTLL